MILITALGTLGASGCNLFGPQKSALIGCPVLAGSAWTPNVPGVAAANHSSNVSQLKQIINTSGPVIGYAQGYNSYTGGAAVVEIPVSITMDTDLGQFGSLSLMAEVTG